MSEPNPKREYPVGTRVKLECGHDIPLPWGLAPEAAASERLRHRTTHASTAGGATPGVFAASFAWLPLPEARR